MYTCPIQLKDVRYDAASQSFEAAVTVHDNCTVRTYACAIQAPLSMNYQDAARGLSKQAIRRHQHRGGLFSQTEGFTPRSRAGRSPFSSHRWFKDLLNLPEHATA